MSVRRGLPRFIRLARREFLVNWEVRRRDVLSRPKYIPDKAPVRVWIISLARTPARKLATVRSLKKYGISFSVYDAVDGLNELNQSEVLRYAGNKKQQRMGLTWSTQTMQLHEYRVDQLTGKTARRRESKTAIFVHERLRFGCYMSHVHVWRSVVFENIPLLVILEDDVELEHTFSSSLQSVLSQLPDNWGALYLGGCFRKLGSKLGDRLYLSRGGLCTHGYVISKLGASVLLNGPAIQSNEPVDHMMDRAVVSGILLAFHVEPPLVKVLSKRSTLAYTETL